MNCLRSSVWCRLGLACALLALMAPAALGQEASAAADLPAFTEDAEVLEPDYRVVAEDARKIADDIEERLIETHMSDASARLSENEGVAGYPKTNEAYVDMKEMIKFCEATGGRSGAACRFKLKIKMGLNPGNTLGQLSKSMRSGVGLSGGAGAGQSGSSGSQMTFGLYGPDSFGEKNRMSDRIGPRKLKNMQSAPGAPDPFAGNVEELDTSKSLDLDVNGGEREEVLLEYRRLIDAYFKRLVNEEGE